MFKSFSYFWGAFRLFCAFVIFQQHAAAVQAGQYNRLDTLLLRPNTCVSDDTIYNGSCFLKGGIVAAYANVSSVGACCSLCHGLYHDECVGWDWSGPPQTQQEDNGISGPLRRTYRTASHPPISVTDAAATTTTTTTNYDTAGQHNCAILSKLGPRMAAKRISGIVKAQPPTPSPSPGPPPSDRLPCRADFDCMPLTSATWSCLQTSVAVRRTPANNCHMHAYAGNQTCACTVQACASIPPYPSYDDKNAMGKNRSSSNRDSSTSSAATMRQYLSIGDSISLGMEMDLRQLFSAEGNWTLTHSPGNAANTNLGAHCLDGWVRAATRKFDVISFNFGLHDIAHDEERLPVQLYTALLTNITAELVRVQRMHGTRLLWVKTTPVPNVPMYGPNCTNDSTCLNPPRYDADVRLYNAAADQVMATAAASGAQIATLDLYNFVLEKCGGAGYKNCPNFQIPVNVHFEPAGWKALAAEVYKAVVALGAL